MSIGAIKTTMVAVAKAIWQRRWHDSEDSLQIPSEGEPLPMLVRRPTKLANNRARPNNYQ